MREPGRLPVTAIATCAGVLGLVLTLALVVGLGSSIATEGERILALTWGRILLLDVYAGLLLFGLWILWRERSRVAAALWIVALLTLGNVVGCAYVLNALRCAGADPQRFWHGPGRGPQAD